MQRKDTLDVLITVDTELWCDGWVDIDVKFPNAFRRYIYGATPSGDYGLPFQLKLLNDHGLKAVFFVEPLFALRFGLAPLEEIVGLIRDAGQSVELHLHTEWVDESTTPVFPDQTGKRQHIQHFSLDEQRHLLETGRNLLEQAGAGPLHAFRAGSFGANQDTLRALASTGIRKDSSFNPVMPSCAIDDPGNLWQNRELLGVLEVPMGVFTDGLGRLRHAQITACSFGEIKAALNQAHRKGWETFVLLSHSVELLNATQSRQNPVVARRFVKLCRYLADNRDRFPTIDFSSSTLKPYPGEAAALSGNLTHTLGRMAEQAWSALK